MTKLYYDIYHWLILGGLKMCGSKQASIPKILTPSSSPGGGAAAAKGAQKCTTQIS